MTEAGVEAARSFGRPSEASERPARLRPAGSVTDAGVRADGGRAGPWDLRAASVAGVRHRLAGAAGDDAYAWRLVGAEDSGQVLVVAVADGVGAVAGSAAASRAAVLAGCDALERTLDPAAPDPVNVAVAGSEAVGEAVAAAGRAVELAGGATTLVVAALGPAGMGWAARIGDSTALVLERGAWRWLWPDQTDPDRPASTATAALPAADPDVEVAAVHLTPGDRLVLVTDGVGDPLRDGPTTVAPALAAALAGDPGPVELAALVDFSRQGCLDDRTLVVLRWEPPAG